LLKSSQQSPSLLLSLSLSCPPAPRARSPSRSTLSLTPNSFLSLFVLAFPPPPPSLSRSLGLSLVLSRATTSCEVVARFRRPGLPFPSSSVRVSLSLSVRLASGDARTKSISRSGWRRRCSLQLALHASRERKCGRASEPRDPSHRGRAFVIPHPKGIASGPAGVQLNGAYSWSSSPPPSSSSSLVCFSLFPFSRSIWGQHTREAPPQLSCLFTERRDESEVEANEKRHMIDRLPSLRKRPSYYSQFPPYGSHRAGDLELVTAQR